MRSDEPLAAMRDDDEPQQPLTRNDVIAVIGCLAVMATIIGGLAYGLWNLTR